MYFLFSQFPEIAALPAEQRKTARTRFIRPLLLRWPVFTVKSLFIFIYFFGGFTLDLCNTAPKTIALIAGYLVVDYLFDLVAVSLQRDRLRSIIRQSNFSSHESS